MGEYVPDGEQISGHDDISPTRSSDTFTIIVLFLAWCILAGSLHILIKYWNNQSGRDIYDKIAPKIV